MLTKCPFRKEIKEEQEKGFQGAIIIKRTENFAKCYGEGCPFYEDNFLDFTGPHCRRIEMEVRKNGD